MSGLAATLQSMIVPSSVFELLAVLLLVVPGIVYAAVRRRLIGPVPEDGDFSVRIARALVASLVLDLTYVIVAGDRLAEHLGIAERVGRVVLVDPSHNASSKAFLALLLLIVIPAVLALLSQLRIVGGRLSLQQLHHPAPTAWDRRATERGDCFVRIWTADGYWVGGLISDQGFISTYPEPRDIFIDVEYHMSADGAFGDPVEGSLGVYVPLASTERVAWLAKPPAS